jgi:Zn-dependent protease with chaperone function
MNPLLLFGEVLAVVVANYLVAWIITVLLHVSVAWIAASVLDRSSRLAERDRVVLWLVVVLLPPITALVQVSWTGAWVPWSDEISILGTFTPGAVAVVTLAALIIVLIALVTWFRRDLALYRLGPRTPARFPAVSVWQSLPDRDGLRPRITRSDRVVAPLLLSDDEIVLPSRTFATLSLAEQRALLAHEQGHLRHRDAIWLGLAGAVVRLLWFQPLARKAWQVAADAAEFAADEHAVRLTGEPRALATGLVSLAAHLPGLAPGLSAAGGRLEERVQRLVVPRSTLSPSRALRRVALVTALVVGMLLLPAPRVDSDRVANTIPWLTPSKDPPNDRMLVLREFLRGRP